MIDLPRPLVLFRKLVLFIAPVFFVLASIGLFVLSSEQYAADRDAFSVRVGNSTARASSSAERILNAPNLEQSIRETGAQQILLMLLGDQAIKCARLYKDGEEDPTLIAPQGIGCRFAKVDEWLKVELFAPPYTALEVGYITAELDAMRKTQMEFSLIVLLGSLVIALIASWIAFRIIVGRPLVALIADLVEARDIADSASKAKTRFLANISHEIRTPMNGIIGTAELLGETKLDQQQAAGVSTIAHSGNALMHIIEDILDFAKIEAEKLELNEEEFLLSEAVYEVTDLVEPTATAKGLNLIIDEIDPETHAFIGDDIRLRQVLMNLMGNAVKFCSKGTVTLKFRVTEKDGQHFASFSVKDTGIGITSEKLSTIFNPFSQANETTTREFGGTGLGLTISAELVGLMGGKLEANSTLGEGSDFFFTIPLRLGPEAKQAASITRLMDISSEKNLRILAVDDVPLNLKVLSARLKLWRLDVTCLEDPADAVEALSRANDQGNPFDVAIIDFDMPGINGEELAAVIREDDALAKTPLVLLSSLAVVTRYTRVKDSPFDATLTKPLRPRSLARALCTVFEEGKKAAEPAKPTENTSAEVDGVLKGLDLLIVDDSDINRDVLSQQLSPTGCSLRIAINGARAVSEVEDQAPDVILMDISMPVMGGFEATRAIRALEQREGRPRCIIFALSANVLQEHKDLAIESGMDGFIAKPTRRAELLSAITSLTSPQMSAQSAQQENALPLINKETATELTAMLGPERLGEFRAKLVDQAEAAFVEIETALAKSDLKDAAAIAHKLAGGAGTLGCTAIAKGMGGLESMLLKENVPTPEDIAELHSVWDRTKAAFASE